MVDNTEKRKRIRAYFFHYPKPKDINLSLKTLLIATLVLGLVIALYQETNWGGLSGRSPFSLGGFLNVLLVCEGLAIIAAFAAMVIMKVAPKIDEVLGTGSVSPRAQQLKKYSDMLQKWGLTETDLMNRPTSQEIDAWLAEDIQSAIPYALGKLGLDRGSLVRDPLVITGPIIWEVPGIHKEDIAVKKGEDGVLRFGSYRIVVICLSDNRIASFSANYNFLRYAFLGESSVEFLYNDIVAVRTEEKATNYNLPDGKVLKSAQVFRLAVANGDNIEVAVSSSQIRDLFGAEPPPNDYEGTVSVIREMLRDKKG